MAAPTNFSQTSYTLPRLESELKAYAGESIPSLLQRHSRTSSDKEILQKAYQEFYKLLENSKELYEKYQKEQATLMNVPIRGRINLDDKMILDYETKTSSSLVHFMKNVPATNRQGQHEEEFNRAVVELHGLISSTHKLEQMQGGNTKKGNRPVFARCSSKDDSLGQPSQPSPPDTAMDTADKGEAKKKPLPIPQSLSRSILQGREMAHMPMIEYQQMVRRMESQQRDIDEMTSRLSRFASNQVTQGNPNIADLSDRNRPTKIGEKFGALYDDEWSEAFEAFKILLKIENENEEPQIISQLLRVVHSALTFCADVANDQLEQLKRNIKQPILEVSFPSAGGKQRETQKGVEGKGLESTSEKYARNFRKECALQCVPAVVQLYKETQKFDWGGSNCPEAIHKYVDRCVELIWLMSVQDPPMFLASAEPGDKVRTDMFTYYGHKGKVVSATVWPAVLLHVDGPIISKGYILPK